MRRRYIGLIDAGVLAIAAVAVLLPAREMFAMEATHGPAATDASRFALALAEARTVAAPRDAVASAALSHRLSEAGFKDWAVEEAVRGAARAEGTPQQWRALFAAAEAYVDQYEAEKGLEFASRALTMCDGSACPDWERVRMDMYESQLEAGVKSGIDPKKEPVKFRAAGERGLRGVRIHGNEAVLQPGAPTPAPAGSAGSAGSAGAP